MQARYNINKTCVAARGARKVWYGVAPSIIYTESVKSCSWYCLLFSLDDLSLDLMSTCSLEEDTAGVSSFWCEEQYLLSPGCLVHPMITCKIKMQSWTSALPVTRVVLESSNTFTPDLAAPQIFLWALRFPSTTSTHPQPGFYNQFVSGLESRLNLHRRNADSRHGRSLLVSGDDNTPKLHQYCNGWVL